MANKIYEHLKLDDQGRVDAEFLNVYQALNSLSSGSGVTSFNTRTGDVSPADGDYSKSLITGLKDADSVKFATLTASNLIDSGLTASRTVVTDANNQLSSGDQLVNTSSNVQFAFLTAGNIIDSGLTASRAVATDANKQFTSSTVTLTELGYLSGVTSSVQTQITDKISKTLISGKGDLIVGTADDTPAILTASATAGHVLQIDSSTTTGLKWAAASETISSGAGAPATTPTFIGQRYIDTTAKRLYIAMDTSASTDWKKQAVYASGTTTVTGGGGDITITLPWSWVGGYLTVICSIATTEWAQEATGGGNIVEIHTSYDALTNAAYTNGGQLIDFRNAAGGTQNIFVEDSSADGVAYPKSATATTFVLNDGGAGTTRYVKYFVWA